MGEASEEGVDDAVFEVDARVVGDDLFAAGGGGAADDRQLEYGAEGDCGCLRVSDGGCDAADVSASAWDYGG